MRGECGEPYAMHGPTLPPMAIQQLVLPPMSARTARPKNPAARPSTRPSLQCAYPLFAKPMGVLNFWLPLVRRLVFVLSCADVASVCCMLKLVCMCAAGALLFACLRMRLLGLFASACATSATMAHPPHMQIHSTWAHGRALMSSVPVVASAHVGPRLLWMCCFGRLALRKRGVRVADTGVLGLVDGFVGRPVWVDIGGNPSCWVAIWGWGHASHICPAQPHSGPSACLQLPQTTTSIVPSV